MVYFWRYFALTLCVTVLFLKTMRITSVFQVDKVAELFTPFFKTIQRQTMLITVMNSIALSLIALWLFLDPPASEKTYPFRRVHIPCVQTISLQHWAFTVPRRLLVHFNRGSPLHVLRLQSQGIPENFNETKYIGFSMYILLLSSLAYYPVVLNFESWYVTLVACSTTLVTSFGLLSCMFGPKMYLLLIHPQRNTVESVRSQVSPVLVSQISIKSLGHSHLNRRYK
ncbi:hypothetical protein OS493_005052 [Desmophyllum pertusum]|uniref:G-protein coupled receptors family 3 profile domain-containing protein n=1 Tax=Desmophyllum pertusum TaxID=174260 RepID=A0A9W9Z7B8_9CNID|nr:hypothetical protein OS493_005052 [Desmophyllum pertusum]